MILDANGNPVLGADGKPLTITDPRVPPGGSIGEGGIILDANGNPVLDASGQPMFATGQADKQGDPRIPPGGSIGKGGVILDANGNPVLGADGKPLTITDPRVPQHPPDGPGSIGEGGVILDVHGNPVLGEDGKPLIANGSSPADGQTSSAGAKRKKKKGDLNGEIMPAGRMVTLRTMQAKGLPDTDLKGSDKNICDPYLIVQILDDAGQVINEEQTEHFSNVRTCAWKAKLKLFCDDRDKPLKRPTPPVTAKLTLMDWNKKTPHTLIGDVTVQLKVGKGTKTIEVPSRCVSSCRPFIRFTYEVSPQMFFETTELASVSGQPDEFLDESAAEGGASASEQS